MKPENPRVKAHVTFLTTDDGGRVCAPVFGTHPRYSQHIVIQSADVRRAVVENGNVCREPYLAVDFVDGPRDFRLGQSADVLLELIYHSRVDYSAVVAGATFTVREGLKVIGYGCVSEQVDTNSSES